MDVPNQRKLNKMVVPTLGGVAIFIGINLSSMLFLPKSDTSDLRFLYATLIIMFFTGLKDDILIISAKKKFAVQLITALILVMLGNFKITHAYGLAGITVLNDWVSIPLSVLVILFLINAINLIDGIDGLATGITIFISTCLGAWFYMAGFMAYGIICASIAGSLLAFLRFNLWGGKNKIFMGDTGSLVLGLLLASIIIKFNELNVQAPFPFRFQQAPLVGLALLIVPITDTLRVFCIRIYNKKSPFSPDMNHIHHLLIKSGLTHIQASSFLVAYTVFFTMLSLTFQAYLDITTGFVLLFGLSLSAVGLIYAKMKDFQAQQIQAEREKQAKTIRLFPSKESQAYRLVGRREKRI